MLGIPLELDGAAIACFGDDAAPSRALATGRGVVVGDAGTVWSGETRYGISFSTFSEAQPSIVVAAVPTPRTLRNSRRFTPPGAFVASVLSRSVGVRIVSSGR